MFLYSPFEDAAATERFVVQNSLPTALAGKQFALEYQPFVNLHSGQATGVEVALDDFGTGYSSLSYLRRLHLGCLKVDHNFVGGTTHNNGDPSIMRTVIALGKALDMKTVAE